MKKMWRCIAEDGNGKVHIFCRLIDEATKPSEVDDLQHFAEALGFTVLAMFRTDDIIEFIEIPREEGTGCSST